MDSRQQVLILAKDDVKSPLSCCHWGCYYHRENRIAKESIDPDWRLRQETVTVYHMASERVWWDFWTKASILKISWECFSIFVLCLIHIHIIKDNSENSSSKYSSEDHLGQEKNQAHRKRFHAKLEVFPQMMENHPLFLTEKS